MNKLRIVKVLIGFSFILSVSIPVTLTIKPVVAEAFKLPDTGQTKCYQDVSPWAKIPCAGTEQDGAYTINPMSFTDNGNGTVTDNNTGLMWQKEDGGNTYNWYKASGTYDATYNPTSQDVCGSLNLGGHSDWRLPTKKELMSIVDYGIPYPGPTIDTTYFPNTKSFYYWSSTLAADYPGYAWSVQFIDGYVYSGDGGSNGHGYVRCVRGEQVAESLTDNGDGTVTDSKTGLVWQQAQTGAMTWGSAFSYCEGLSLGGQSDWRLPNIKELESITDDTKCHPAIDTNFFPNAYASFYWSSTSIARYPNVAWDVYFDDGSVSGDGKDSGHGYVRCVRGGLIGSFIECNLVPDATIVPKGGTLGFQATATNNTDQSQTFLFVTFVTTPGGNRYPASGWLIGPVSVTLGGNASKSGHKSHAIPSGAALGTYTYHGYVGNYGPGNYSECQFQFTVTP